MLNMRALYGPNDTYPPPRTLPSVKPTLLVCWWCTCLCVFIILARLLWRYIRTLTVYVEDWYMLASMFPLLVRMGFVHVVLLYGTNNVNVELLEGSGGDWEERMIVGSKVVLAARVAYAGFIWSQKFCITVFYKRLIPFDELGPGLKAIRWSLLVTFLATVISVFAECRPTEKASYSRRRTAMPSSVHSASNDVRPQRGYRLIPCLLSGLRYLAVPTPSSHVCPNILLPTLLLNVQCRTNVPINVYRKIQLMFLLSLSLVCVVVSLCKVPNVINRLGAQPYRSLWASFECLAGCVVANAVVLNSFARDKGPRRRSAEDDVIVTIRKYRLKQDLEASASGNLDTNLDDDMRMMGIGLPREAYTRSSMFHDPEAIEAVDSGQWKTSSSSDRTSSPQLQLQSGGVITFPESAKISASDTRSMELLNVGGLSLTSDEPPPPPPTCTPSPLCRLNQEGGSDTHSPGSLRDDCSIHAISERNEPMTVK
ncbi:hypothetical protein RUND412_003294 [Rhizina undulata]